MWWIPGAGHDFAPCGGPVGSLQQEVPLPDSASVATMTTSDGWRTGELEVDEPAVLLARGLAQLDGLAADPTPSVRWYRSTRTAIVLGRGQRDGTARSTDAVQVLTRHSGGGAVLLDPSLLSADVAVPAGHPWLEGDLSRVFRHVGEAWRDALTDLGVPDLEVYDGPAVASRRGSARDRLLADVCYATLGRGEVLVAGRKLVGLSQRRRRPGALVQCGLLRRWDPGVLLEALGADPADAEILEAAAGLDDLAAAGGWAAPSEEAVIAAVSARLAG